MQNSYNHGKKNFVWFERESDPSPLSPNVMLIRVMLSEALQITQHWLMGVGKDYDKSENLCFILNDVMPHFLFQRLAWG